MKLDCFEKPVRILVGLGFPREIRDIREAHRLLSEWPEYSRNQSHAVALRACAAALRGDIEAETARGALVAFARRNNLLIDESGPATASGHLGRPTLSGGAA